MKRNCLSSITIFLLVSLLAACGGGGAGNGADGAKTTANAAAAAGTASSDLPFPLSVVIANAKFLLFPNPQRQGFGGVDQTNTQEYATAYYTAIDGGGQRVSKSTFRTKNKFGACTSSTADEKVVVFGDANDLGYGRRMCARKTDNNGCLAFMVDNYLVETGTQGYTYSSVNVDAAVVQSSPRFVSTSAIEYCDLDGPDGANGPKFLKFFVFDTSGNRKLMVDQDGLGEKAMPNICVNCHGGRADPLTSTVPRAFATVGNAVSQVAGDTTSRLQSLKVHTFDFSTLTDPTIGAVRSRASQETDMKAINQWVHDSYSTTGVNEWDGAVAQSLIQTAYGGVGFPSATYSDAAATSFVPDVNWTTSGQAGLYQNVVAPGCMTCHILRGTKNQDDISFRTFTKFNAYADRIKAHVYDRGNMPLAKIVFEQFWKSGSTMPQQLAAVPSIAAQGATSTLQPGRPIADPGPDRHVMPGTLTLSAINSLYATSFSWSIISNPGGGGSISGANNASTVTLNLTTQSSPYVIRLTAAGNGLTDTKDITVLVNSSAPPTATTFANIKPILATCQAGCHQGNGASLSTTPSRPPLSYDIVDYGNDDNAFYQTVKGRINFTDVIASPLLRKPSGNHHGGNLVGGFDTTKPLGDPARFSYDTLVTWIMAGAPQ